MEKCAVKFSTGSVSGLRLSLCGYFSGIWALDRTEIWGPGLLKEMTSTPSWVIEGAKTYVGLQEQSCHFMKWSMLSVHLLSYGWM